MKFWKYLKDDIKSFKNDNTTFYDKQNEEQSNEEYLNNEQSNCDDSIQNEKSVSDKDDSSSSFDEENNNVDDMDNDDLSSSNETDDNTSSMNDVSDNSSKEQGTTSDKPNEEKQSNLDSSSTTSEISSLDEGIDNKFNNCDVRNNEQSDQVESGMDGESLDEEIDKVSVDKKVEQVSDEQSNDLQNKLSNEQKKELLEKLKRNIEEIRKRKADKLKRERINSSEDSASESKEEKYELSEQTNKFLNQLGELPSFKERDRGAGYSIDTDSFTELPDSLIRTLISKFLNQRFLKNSTDLNIRSNSLEKTKGFYKWEVKDVIKHLETHQITKVLDDKYGYEYANGRNENVPLSFYFDLSGSMSDYTNLLSIIAIELLKKNVKVLIGFNERVNVQIDSISKNITVLELAEFLENAGYYSWNSRVSKDKLNKYHNISFKYVDKNIDNYLISKKAEKCVVFADFDPISEVINLSQQVSVYWFCFENYFGRYDLKGFNGFIYKVEDVYDICEGLIKVSEKKFETLCYIEKTNELKKKLGG